MNFSRTIFLVALLAFPLAGRAQTQTRDKAPTEPIPQQEKSQNQNQKEDHAASPDDPDHAVQPDVHPKQPPKYFIPDLGRGWNEFDNKAFSFSIGLAPIADRTWFSQDANSVTQVGEEQGRWDLRSGRIMFRGQIHTRRPINYYLVVEYKGLDRPDESPKFGITDFWFSMLLHQKVGTLTVGKMKETFVYEMVGDSANLAQTERTLNPFFASRKEGIKLSNSIFSDRMTYAVGWYNDWFTHDQTFKESSNDVTARVTGVPIYSKDGRNYLHLGAAYRYNGAEYGTIRLKGKPETNIGSNYVDTGDIISSHQNAFGLEMLANRGPASVLVDFARTSVHSPASGFPRFYGVSVIGAYTITGENRPYDRKVGYARRIIPEGHWGAWEIVARYSHIDLDDKSVRGGILHKTYLGLNWWASRQWRISFGYGLADLDRKDLSGRTHIFMMRYQWVF